MFFGGRFAGGRVPLAPVGCFAGGAARHSKAGFFSENFSSGRPIRRPMGAPARRKGGPRGLSAVLSNPARPALRVIQLFRTRRNRMNRQGARTETIFGKRPTPAGYCKASFNFRVSSGTGRLCEAAGVRRKGRPNFVRSSSRLARPERTPFQPSGTSMALKKSCRSGTPSVFLTGMYCYSVCRKPVFTAPASGS